MLSVKLVDTRIRRSTVVLYLTPPLYASSFPPFFIYILELQHSLNKGEVPAASGHLSYLKPQPLLLWLSNIFPFPLLFEIITVTREPSFIVLLNLQDKKIAEQRISTQISAFQVTYKKLCILFIPLILF